MIVLWVFQTFFLESFYTATKSSQVEKNAQVISKSIEENKNALGTIENVASYNSLSVYVYDSTSLFTLKYCCEYDNPVSNLNFQYHDVYSYYKLAEENDGHYLFITSNYKEDSIKGKFERQFFDEYSSSDTAERNTIRYASAPDKNVQNMVYTDIINLQDGSECFLIVTSSITPLTNTVEIVRDQLAIVSVVFVLLAVIISLYASYRIAKPISKTNTAAKELAKKNYDVDFNARGYLEVEELNETLNYAKTELAATEKLQKNLLPTSRTI